jgi:hypothetical protein
MAEGIAAESANALSGPLIEVAPVVEAAPRTGNGHVAEVADMGEAASER